LKLVGFLPRIKLYIHEKHINFGAIFSTLFFMFKIYYKAWVNSTHSIHTIGYRLNSVNITVLDSDLMGNSNIAWTLKVLTCTEAPCALHSNLSIRIGLTLT
jgi:hypothetical protein